MNPTEVNTQDEYGTRWIWKEWSRFANRL